MNAPRQLLSVLSGALLLGAGCYTGVSVESAPRALLPSSFGEVPNASPMSAPLTTLRDESCDDGFAAQWSSPSAVRLFHSFGSASSASSQQLVAPLPLYIPESIPVAEAQPASVAVGRVTLAFAIDDDDLGACTYLGNADGAFLLDSCDELPPACNLSDTVHPSVDPCVENVVEADTVRVTHDAAGSEHILDPFAEDDAIAPALDLRLDAPAKWVVPGALRNVHPDTGAMTAHLSWDPDSDLKCTYAAGEGQRVLELVSCTGLVQAGSVIASASAFLEVDDAVSCLDDTARSVEARLLPPIPEGYEEDVILQLNPPTAVFTAVGQTRRLEVRAFLGAREVNARSLDLQALTLDPEVAAVSMDADGGLLVTALALSSDASVGVSTDAGVSVATSVTTAPLRSHVVEVRASHVAFPSTGITPYDDEDDPRLYLVPNQLGAFSIDDLLPETPLDADEPTRRIAIIDAAAQLQPGDIFAITDGNGPYGLVTQTEVRGPLSRVEYVPLTPQHIFSSMAVDYRGELEAADLTTQWQAEQDHYRFSRRAGLSRLDAVQADTPAGLTRDSSPSLLGPNAAADPPASPTVHGAFATPPQNLGARFKLDCGGALANSLVKIDFVNDSRHIRKATDFAFRFNDDATVPANPALVNVGTFAGLNPAQAAARLATGDFAEFRFRAAGIIQFSRGLDIIANLGDFEGSFACTVNGRIPVPTPIPAIQGFVEAETALTLSAELSGGPSAFWRPSWSKQYWYDAGLHMGTTVGPLSPHPDTVDLDGKDGPQFFEFKVEETPEDAKPLFEIDANTLGLSGEEPNYAVKLGLELAQSLKVGFAPPTAFIGNLPIFAKLGTNKKHKFLAHIRDSLADLEYLSAEVRGSIAINAETQSSGRLLQRSFDNTQYECHELNRVGLEISPLAFTARLVDGLDALLPKFLGFSLLDINLEFTATLGTLSALNFYGCQNPAFGQDTTTYVRRDSRYCGEVPEDGESPRLYVEAFSSPTPGTVFGSPQGPHPDAYVYLQNYGGIPNDTWKELGGAPFADASGVDGQRLRYEGEFELDAEASERLSGDGGDPTASFRMLTHTDYGAIPMYDQLTEATPACGCFDDTDCLGDAVCSKEPADLVGECGGGLVDTVVFNANGVAFTAPGTNKAIVGTSCESDQAEDVQLRALGYVQHDNEDDAFEITSAEFYLDGARAPDELVSVSSDEGTAMALGGPVDLSAGDHTLALVMKGTLNGEAWETIEEATFPVRTEVEDCECPSAADACDAYGMQCGTLDTANCGSFECGDMCDCFGGQCSGGLPGNPPSDGCYDCWCFDSTLCG